MLAALLNNQAVVVQAGGSPPPTGSARKRVKAMGYVGDFTVGATVRLPWDTYGADGASITRATNGTLRIYKDNSPTERLSLAGVSQVEDFDSVTGSHTITVNLADNTDPGFYATGHDYAAVMVGMVIDGATVNETIGLWSIENRTAATSSAAAVADAVWDEVRAGHVTGGTFGEGVASVQGAVTGAVGSVTVVADKTGYRLSGAGVDDILRTALPESYAADGAAATLTQLLYLIQQAIIDKTITGTTMTIRQLNGSSTAATATLNSASTPTAITRTT